MRLKRVINGTFEEEVALINVETNEVLIKGDAYHDKIDERIEGFLYGLLYANVKHSLVDEDLRIMPTDKLFDICDFSNEDYSSYDNDDDEVVLSDCEVDEEEVKIDKIIEVRPHLINHKFEISAIDKTFIFYGNIVEALDKTLEYEGDLFIVEGCRYSIVYSCQGLELEDNNNCLKEFGVQYEEDGDGWKELVILNRHEINGQ